MFQRYMHQTMAAKTIICIKNFKYDVTCYLFPSSLPSSEQKNQNDPFFFSTVGMPATVHKLSSVTMVLHSVTQQPNVFRTEEQLNSTLAS